MTGAAATTGQQGIDLPAAMLTRVVVVGATRRRLLDESAAYLARADAHLKTVHGERPRTAHTDAAFDAFDGLTSAGTCMFLIAAMLRRVEAADPALAQRLAELVEVGCDVGLEALDGANDDLPQPDGAARAAR